MRRRFPRPSAGLVVAVVALFVALGGTALAKIIINGSDLKNRSVGAIKIKKNSLGGTEINESKLSTVPSAKNAQNAQSAQNANTVGGKAPGAFAPADRWALIAGNTTGANVLAQSGGLAVQRFNTGVYLVNAGGSVVGKPLSATLNVATQGFVSVAPCGGNANNPGGFNCPLFNDTNHVLVVTRNTAAAAADATFYLSIGG